MCLAILQAEMIYAVIVYPRKDTVEAYEVDSFGDLIEYVEDIIEKILDVHQQVSSDNLRLFLLERKEDLADVVTELEDDKYASTFRIAKDYLLLEPFMAQEDVPGFEVKAFGRYYDLLYKDLKPSYRFAIILLYWTAKIEFVSVDIVELEENRQIFSIEELRNISKLDELVAILRSVSKT